MKIEELRDALKNLNEKEYLLMDDLLSLIDKKKSVIKHIREEEKHDTPVRLEFRGDPKIFTHFIIRLVQTKRLLYNGTDNYTRIIHELTSVMDVINMESGKMISPESLHSYVKRERAGE
jgi:hypothetical protein